ncbi:MAG TPA: hypothetical protein PKO10_01055 [Aliarcobacter cryaerophilus]|nr:hypothetical protein [Aliarcobacter cryaerophilus]
MNNQVFEEMKSIAKDYYIVFLDENDIEKCKYELVNVNNVNWYNISQNQKLSEEFIREFADEVDWCYISIYQKLSEEFIREFASKVDWHHISINQKLSEGFIREFADKVNWWYISACQKLSEEFIREFSSKVYWINISINQKLSKGFIREFASNVNWICISREQKLSEGFIREFADKVDWTCISVYQKLSEEFIRESSNKVNWDCISKYQKLSKSFIKENNLTISKDNWLYKTKKEKLSYLKKHCKDIYEIVDDKYIIAYKSTKFDGYSTYNFQYQYKENEVYETHCDCNIDNNASFGLSVWTKEKALEHYKLGKLFKVHINIEDIGAIVHNNKKIRCSKLTVVSEESFE